MATIWSGTACRSPAGGRSKQVHVKAWVAVCATTCGRQGQEVALRLEQVRGLRIDGDASGGNVAYNVGQEVEMVIVLIDGKGAGIAPAIGGQGDGFADIGWAHHAAIWVKA